MDNQLPAEVISQIEESATAATDREEGKLKENNPNIAYGPMLAQLSGFKRGHITCAIEYATKLIQEQEDNKINLDEIKNLSAALRDKDAALQAAQQEIESLTNQLKDHGRVSDENMKLLRLENETGRTLVEKLNAIYGDLHAGVLANEIKIFLDGTK